MGGRDREVGRGSSDAGGAGGVRRLRARGHPRHPRMLDDGVAWTSPRSLPQGGTYKGREEVGSFFESLGSAWERLDVEPEAMGEVGDELVVAVVRLNGTRRGGGASGWGAVHAFS